MKRLVMVAGLGMFGFGGACGKGAPQAAPSADAPTVVSAPETPRAAEPVAPPAAGDAPAAAPNPTPNPADTVVATPKARRVSREECAKATDHMLELAVKQLAAKDSPEVEAVKAAMSEQREDFLARCLEADQPEVVACMLAASQMDDLMKCGGGPTPGSFAIASEDECRRFVEKLDTLALNGKMPELSDDDRKKVDAQKEAIIKQCAREAPQEVIRCALAASTIEEIDTCHDRYGALVEDKGGHAGHDHHDHDGHDHHGHDGHDHGNPAPRKVATGPLASEDECRRFTIKFMELTAQGKSPEEAGAMRKRMVDGLETIVRDCASSMPKSVIACGLAAENLDAVMKCQP